MKEELNFSISNIIVLISGLLILTDNTDQLIKIATTHPVTSGIILIIIALI